MQTTPLRRPRTLAQGLVEQLSAQIRDGRLAPHTKLPTEGQVMQAYGVSRTVVREALSRLQAAFHEKLGTQCGFCTPGMIMAAESLLRKNPTPARDEIKEALSGNLCRCTGYVKIIESVEAAVAAGEQS